MDNAARTQRQLIDELTRLRQRIADLEQAETRRQQTQESYQVLVDHSLQGMAIYQDGRVVFANARLAEILGRPIDELQAMLIDNGGLAELVHPDDQPRIRGYLRDRAKGRLVPPYYEVRVLHPNQDVRWVEIQTVAIYYADRPAVQAVLVDITERKRAEERFRYQANLLQNVSDAIVSSDLDFKIVSWNKAAEDLYGWRAEEVIGKPIHQVLQSVYPGYSWDSVVEAFLVQGHWEGEIIQSRKDDGPIHVYARASQVKDETGKRIGAVTINRDITERKQAEQELRAAQANLNALMENTTDYILIGDDQGFPVIFNTAYAQIMKEALGIEMRPGLKPHTLLPDPESVAWWDNLHKRVLGGESFRVQYSLELPQKGLRYYEFSYHPIVVDGEVKGFSELSRDITERERMAETLRESQAVLTEAQRIGCMGNWVRYLDTGELRWSDELYRIFGQERQPVTSERFLSWIHPEDRERVHRANQTYRREKSRLGIEFRIIRPDGEERTLHAWGEVICDDQGKGVKTVGTAHDITELKRAEQALRESEEKYRNLVELSPDPVVILQDGIHQYVNPAFTEVFGYTREDVAAGLAVTDLVQEKERAATRQRYSERLNGKSLPKFLRIDMVTKDRRLIPCETSSTLIPYRGQPATLVIIRDITEREAMQQALRESEANLREAQRIAHIGNWVFYLDTGKLYWSDELYRIFGRKQQELDPDRNFLWVHPDDRERVREAAVAYIREKGRMDIEYRIIREDGEERIIHSQGEVICDDQGNALKTVGTVQDVTKQREAEKALHQSYYLLERSQQLANLGSWQWDLSTDRVLWSRQMHRIHGTNPDQYPDGVPIDEVYRFIHPDDLKQVQDAVREVVEEGTGTPFEYHIVRPDGGFRRLIVDGHVVTDDSGKPVRIVGMVQDITERKQAEEQALALLGEQERSRILAQFIQDASHEFRTPLSMIGLNAHAIKGMTDPFQRIERLQRIEGLVRNITGLVDNLVTMARLDSGIPLKMGAINISEIVGHVKATMQGAISKARVQVFTESTVPEDLMVQGNLDYLYQAIASILDNAIRYTPPGGTITLRTYPREDQVVLEVQDTGSGIDAQTLPHIFERFYRADQAHSTSGFGLGLPIAQKIIERHGGQIEVESKVAKGSVFRIVLNI